MVPLAGHWTISPVNGYARSGAAATEHDN